MHTRNPYAAPKAKLRDHEDGDRADISQLPVSESWKTKFRILERAGGVKLPKFRELSFGERLKVNFNVLAFLFGPLYYAAKGMWRKGLAMFLACALGVVAVAFILAMMGLERFSPALIYGAQAIFSSRATIDYYKKMVLRDNGWW